MQPSRAHSNFGIERDVDADRVRSIESMVVPLFTSTTTVPSQLNAKGALAFDKSTDVPMYCDGIAWHDLAGGVAGVTTITATTPIVVTPSPITTTGNISLATQSLSPGTYTNPTLTVNQYGIITGISNGSTGITSIVGGTGISVSTVGSTSTISLAPSGVTAGNYNLLNASINAQGQITSAGSSSLVAGTNVTITPTGTFPDISYTISATGGGGGGTVTSVAAGTGLVATPSPITTTGTLSLAPSGVTAGSYTLMSGTVNAQGQITAAGTSTLAGGTGIAITSAGTFPNLTYTFNSTGSGAGSGGMYLRYNSGTAVAVTPSFTTFLGYGLNSALTVTGLTLTGNSFDTISPRVGVLQSLYVRTATAVLAGSTGLTFTVFLNGTATTLSATVPAGSNTANNTGTQVPVAPGDLLSMQVSTDGGFLGIAGLLEASFEA